MKRSISVTSINSTDSVIPIEAPVQQQQTRKTTRSTANGGVNISSSSSSKNIQTRSRSTNVHNTSNNSNTSLLNNSQQQQQQQNNKRRSPSPPCSLVYVDSESTNLSEANGNKNDEDDISSFASSDIASSEKSSVNSGDSSRPRRLATHFNADNRSRKKQKLNYKFAAYAKEDHGNEIYSVQIYNGHERNPEHIVFATVGSNRCSVYEYNTRDHAIRLIDSFMDADQKEIYFACCWTNDFETGEPLLAFGGLKGIIRTILPFGGTIKSALFGHGSSINDLRIHPIRKTILVSASKDYTIRLWNLKNDLCVCILGGCEGHRDEVLSADFSLNGSLLVSCSIDHSLKVWNLNIEKIQAAIKESEEIKEEKHKFVTATHHFPEYTTRDVHANYIDCVRWFGDLILSKSCENSVVLWKPGLLHESVDSITRNNKNLSIIHKFPLKECDIWYIRFSLDQSQKILALGTQTGKIYVWNLDTDEPTEIKQTLLTHLKSKRAIRSTALSLDGKYLIAVNDESYIWIWKNE